ncbi:unnamed protein product [Phytophthora fragariaefolia]|uniref:Unnamed protein product n=1 Tax=Phytophthora fragariaefolia TaxID=1490495 RepID=A0A9W7CTY7_9STRA|nr:unnamed protein product [Phytophthora fragariaefolia]
MVRVPGPSGDSGFHHESLEDVQVMIEQGDEASPELGSTTTRLNDPRQDPPTKQTKAGRERGGIQAKQASTRVKMKAPDQEGEDPIQVVPSWSDVNLEYAFHQKELRDFLALDSVMRMLELKQIEDLQGPLAPPQMATGKLDAVKGLMSLLKEAGLVACGSTLMMSSTWIGVRSILHIRPLRQAEGPGRSDPAEDRLSNARPKASHAHLLDRMQDSVAVRVCRGRIRYILGATTHVAGTVRSRYAASQSPDPTRVKIITKIQEATHSFDGSNDLGFRYVGWQGVTHLLRSARDFAPSYIDDVFIHSRAVNGKSEVEMHKEHLRKLFALMRKHKLYANLKKCIFGASEIPVLGCLVGKKGVRPDPGKVRVINEWPTPSNVKELRQFLGLATQAGLD